MSSETTVYVLIADALFDNAGEIVEHSRVVGVYTSPEGAEAAKLEHLKTAGYGRKDYDYTVDHVWLEE